ncbi:LysR family transcriptional regulator [Neobacillus sp. PS3-34]|uniref:LysR family transcriptional regulator n=1 Tax=Neobacillus sp. PS3-34 TaxID=3070678 RepID=UPI0027E20267|nr:LysR family transcriptional regulator [Neobacillus sp. PS3-34]WML49182.1 LysR family transcriptional regulator [Neobacillus sp. PS3-34]
MRESAIFQYEVFLTVVETGSFTKAGEKLGLSQSGVSHNISTLETELGIVLLRRNRNGITLTDAGERVLPHIRQIIHHGKLLEQEAALIQGIEVGSIKIGTFPSFSSRILPGLIRNFINKYPGIQIELYEGGYDEIKDWIASGTIDIGFLTLPSREFETIPLFKDELLVLVPESHRLNTMKVIQVKSMQNESFIMPKAGCDALIKGLLRENNVQPHVIFEIKDNHTIISMVQEGLGITIIPEMVLPKNISNTKVIPLETELYREIGIAIKSIKQASPSVKKFIKIAKEHVKQEQLE